MKLVSRFEANLLRILDCFLGRCPVEQALPLVLRELPEPKCLSRDAVSLVEDRLAKGCVRRLARTGGWRPRRFLRGNRIAAGRLWERTPPAELGLRFSGQSLRFLIWVTASKPGPQGWSPALTDLTEGDLLLLYLAYGALRQTEAEDALKLREAFDRNGLVRLAYAEDFDLRQSSLAPDFAPWLSGVGGGILESLQPELAERWQAMESTKKDITDARKLRALGQRQEAVLERFLEAVEQAGRLDLARFLLEAAGQLLTTDAGRQHWIHSGIDAGATLAERQQTYQAGLALVRQLDRFQKWEQRARSVGYFDEGYAAAQLCKDDWEEQHGEVTVNRARAILREVDPLASH